MQALSRVTEGKNNSAFGLNSLTYATTGSNNSAVGVNAGLSNTTGSHNCYLGHDAGYAASANGNSTGSNNSFIGHNSVNTSATTSNAVTLGDGNISALRCNQTSISSLSDARDKTEIVDLPVGLEFLNSIRPVKFKWQRRTPDTNDGKIRAGFIAQELQEAQKDSKYLDLIFDDNPDILEARQSNLIPVMVKAIQELSAENTALKARLDAAGL